jgi:hypothetical protein
VAALLATLPFEDCGIFGFLQFMLGDSTFFNTNFPSLAAVYLLVETFEHV